MAEDTSGTATLEPEADVLESEIRQVRPQGPPPFFPEPPGGSGGDDRFGDDDDHAGRPLSNAYIGLLMFLGAETMFFRRADRFVPGVQGRARGLAARNAAKTAGGRNGGEYADSAGQRPDDGARPGRHSGRRAAPTGPHAPGHHGAGRRFFARPGVRVDSPAAVWPDVGVGCVRRYVLRSGRLSWRTRARRRYLAAERATAGRAAPLHGQGPFTGVALCAMYWYYVVALWPILYGLVYLY